MDWTMAKAKEDFHRGLLVACSIDKAPLGSGWTVRLRASMPANSSAGFLLDARRKSPRVFKSMDAAVSAVAEIGLEITSWKAF